MAGNIEGDIVYFRPPEPVPADARPDFESLPLAAERMPIQDMRGREAEFTLDRQGFTLAQAPTTVGDFHDPAEVAGVYVPEVQALVREVTGCAEVVVSSPGLVRVSRRASERSAGAAPTGNFAHADFSYSSGEFWLRRTLAPEEAEARLRKRYAIFNVWRAFSPPPQDFPLALCDARSVAPPDIQNCTITLGRPGIRDPVTWENTAYRHNPSHRWFYCSDMNRDEAFVFRSFDSDPASSVHVPHTAFEDLTCPDSAPPRASLEIRMFAFWED
jgi:hypothetical protein